MSVSKQIRRQVIQRDEGRCVITGEYLVDPDTLEPLTQYSIHHRRPRGMGGSKDPVTDSPENLLLVSGTGTTGSHGWIESHRSHALDEGYIVPRWQDPAIVPVKHRLYGWAWPTPDGVWIPAVVGGQWIHGSYTRVLADLRGIPIDPTDPDFIRLTTAMYDVVTPLGAIA